MKQLLEQQLNKEGYFDLREIEGKGMCGLFRFAFTIGLVYGLDSNSYIGRYCYPNLADAKNALASWDGVGNPKDKKWIKHKGWGIDEANTNIG